MMHVNTCVQTTFPAPALGAVILVAAIAIPAYCGWRKPGYSHLRHTISELGEAGSPVAVEAAIGFVAIGVLVWLFLATVASTSTLVPQEALWQFSLVGVGYVGGGLFPCDRGAPVSGTTRNTVHVVCGVLEYVGAAAAFAVLSRDAVWASITPALSYATPVVLICLWGISIPHPLRGLVQRVAEAVIFVGLALIGFVVSRS
jgi:hypothetical protein